ncbi:MAG: peptidase [Candidatus Saccharibacteria bacterium]|nr:peptidase [Candidatus Saccharibacteria bacterium]
MRPLIGITAGEVYNMEHPWSPYVFGQSYTYVDAVIDAGGTPVILPITQTSEVIDQLFDSLDGILFAGGNDITPQLYGQELSQTIDNSKIRDDFEIVLMQKALDVHKPMLCICRGMQLLNVVRGGTLYQDIPTELPGRENHSSSNEAKSIEHLAHTLAIEPTSHLAQILGTSEIKSNSHHHQAVNKIGNGLIVSARAEDGIIEGLEDMGDGYIIAVQSHPESLFQLAEPKWRLLFQSHIAASKKA